LIDLTPEIHKEATEIAASFDRGGLFTPPSLRGTIQVPGKTGGANWAGAAVDPETGIMYVGTQRLPSLATVRKPQPSESSYDFIGGGQFLSGPRDLPLLKPPFGSIVAIDMTASIAGAFRSAAAKRWLRSGNLASMSDWDCRFEVGR